MENQHHYHFNTTDKTISIVIVIIIHFWSVMVRLQCKNVLRSSGILDVGCIMEDKKIPKSIMTKSPNGNIFRVTDPLCGEFTGHRLIPRTNVSDAELWCFLWSAPWINGWVNNHEAGDSRRHRAHCDVIVMMLIHCVTIVVPVVYLVK